MSKESLDLLCVQFAGHHPVGTCCAKEIGHELGTNRYTRTVLAVLTGPSEIWNDGDYRIGRSALGSIDGEQEFHKVICRRNRGLYDIYAGSSNALLELWLKLSVTELSNTKCAEFLYRLVAITYHIQLLDYPACEIVRCPAGK